MSDTDVTVRIKGHIFKLLKPIVKEVYSLELGDTDPSNPEVVNKALIDYIKIKKGDKGKKDE